MKRRTPTTPKPPTLAEKIAKRTPLGLIVQSAEADKIRLRIDSAATPDRFRSVGGSDDEFANVAILNRVLGTLPQTTDLAETAIQATNVVRLMEAFAPKDPVEAAIASQAVALHIASMECARRAMLPQQTADVASRLRKDAANLSRSMVDMSEALDRRRGKGPQVVRVERVVVNEGGQAVVGHVQTGAALPASGDAPRALGQAAPPMQILDPAPVSVGVGEGDADADADPSV